MKKITFLFALFTLATNAQTFPAPYCTISDPDEVGVEEISTVNFGNVTITNTNDADVLVNYVSTVVPVAPGQSYMLKVFGNTYGDFDTDVVAFIDWNNNGILDDQGEIYEVGTLTDTDGTDGIFVTMQITVPATAAIGTARVRITKVYTDEDAVAIVDPCAISFEILEFGAFPSYGQALDFTLDVNTLGTSTFDTNELAIYPVPAKEKITIAYNAPIGNVQIYNQMGQEVYANRNIGTQADVDISNFATGVYFVKLFNETQSQTFRIIKE